MKQTTVEQAMQIAFEHHRAGRLAEAEAIYRQVLGQLPDYADALHLLGTLACQTGHLGAAIDLISRAIVIAPYVASYHNDLGEVYRRAGRLAEAIHTLGRAVELNPDLAVAHGNLGNALLSAGRSKEAIAAFDRSLAIAPRDAQVHVNLGAALHATGRSEEAISAYKRAIAIVDDDPRAFNNLGKTLLELGRLDEAIAALERAITLDPKLAEIHNNLGNALKEAARFDEAMASFGRASTLNPNLAEAHNNLGGIFCLTGRLDESLACFRRAVALKPDFLAAASTLLVMLYFHPDYDAQAILAEHRRWDARFAAPLTSSIQPHLNDPSPNRRLRIGYISPDWPSQAGRFLLPLFKSHDHTNFEVFFYSLSSARVVTTGGCRDWADVWREIAGHSDLDVARIIRQDNIDILIDRYMHSPSGCSGRTLSTGKPSY